MSSVSAACIFDAYSASSAHTDTFYIVSQIVRVRNSKRHFFSKLTFPYIIQPLCFTLRSHRPQPPRFHPTVASTTAASLSPYGNIDHSHSASPYGNIDHSHSASPYGNIDRSRSASPYGNIDHSRSASPYGNIDHSRSASPYGHIDHNRSASPTATSTTALHFAQQSRLNSSAENFSYFFKKALDKYPKTVYNVYCYLGVAQIGSALPWGGRGRRFKSCHSDQLKTA